MTSLSIMNGGQNYNIADVLTVVTGTGTPAITGGTGFSVPVSGVAGLPGTELYISGLVGSICVGDYLMTTPSVDGVQPATMVLGLDNGDQIPGHCSTGTTNPYTVSVTQLRSGPMSSGGNPYRGSGALPVYNGHGKLWVLPAGFERHNSSRIDNSVVQGWGFGIKNACSDSYDIHYGCSTSLDEYNLLQYDIVGRLTAGDQVAGETAFANFYHHNYYSDVVDFGAFGTSHFGENYESAEEGNSFVSIITSCVSGNGTIWTGLYNAGNWEPSCMNPSPDANYGLANSPPTGAAFPLGSFRNPQFPLSNIYAGNPESWNGGLFMGLSSHWPTNGSVITQTQLRNFRQLSTGRSLNTDLAGRATLAGGSFKYTFANQQYTLPPICQCSDTTTTAAVCNAAETNSNVTFTVSGGTLTDQIKWQCTGQTGNF